MQSEARPYALDTNLELHADSVDLFCLPLKNSFVRLKRGEQVVVAETNLHPNDSVDVHWVKLAASEQKQGWIRESEMKTLFVPTDSVSQFIHVFSHTNVPGFLAICTLFLAVWLMQIWRKKKMKLVWFNDIDTTYPLFLCLLMAFCATIYETMQVFMPEVWERFYFNPSLSPLDVPWILSLFLIGIWLFIIVLIAVIDVVFRRLQPAAALFYMLSLAAACIFCYFFFILTTSIYVGYLFLGMFLVLFLRRLFISLRTVTYSCGRCGHRMHSKGRCPHCGVLNE